MRKIYFLFSLLVAMTLSTQAQVQVILQVDMSLQMNVDTVSAAGSFQVAAGFPSDWTPGTTLLTDPDMDGIYTDTLMLPAGSYEYKFLNGTAWGTDEGVPGSCAVNGNRGMTIGTSDTTIAVVCFGQCTACPTTVDTVEVTLQVNMRNELFLNGGDTVSVAGSFQGAVVDSGWSDWTPGLSRLSDPDGDSIFSITFRLPEGTYAYKFLNGTAWGTDESIPAACNVNGNREMVIVGPNDTTFDVVCFGTCLNNCPLLLPPVNVTFRVDMNNEIVNSKGVHVAGSFQDPAWQKGADEMLDGDGDGVYEVTISIGPDEYQYKFVNGDSDPEEETADFIAGGCGVSNGLGGSNRLLDIIGLTQDTVLPVFVYNSCSTSAVGIEDDLNASVPVSVYPNPFTQSTTLSFSNEQGLSYTIEVLNINGQVIKREDNFRGNELEISSESMTPGMYLLSIRNPQGERYTKKLILK